MDTAQWPQEIVVRPIDEIVVRNTACPRPPLPPLDHHHHHDHEMKKARPQKEQALNCPRCHSTNTKFCYYNNYSLTQPRYFCKTCRRYWTQGGSLRNIPVGGASRKNKRPSSSSSSILIPPPPKSIKLSTNNTHNDNNTPASIEGQDLNLSFPHHISSLELIRGLNNTTTPPPPFMPSSSSIVVPTHDDPNIAYNNTSFPLPLLHNGFKASSSLNFNLDGFGTLQETTSGRILFPFEELKLHGSSTINTTTMDHGNNNKDQLPQGDSTDYWAAGMLGGGSW